MAHDLTEISSQFSHEEFTPHLVNRRYDGYADTLAQVVSAAWRVDIDNVLRVLTPDSESAVQSIVTSWTT